MYMTHKLMFGHFTNNSSSVLTPHLLGLVAREMEGLAAEDEKVPVLVCAPPPPPPPPTPEAAVRLSRSEYSLQGSDMETVGSRKVIGCSPRTTL